MQKKPKISIITASKNGGRFLRETIESILHQTFTDYEHILVDGASTDDTLELLKTYKHIKWISEPDRHADEGFYKALHMAAGDYVMFACLSDGYMDEHWFQKCAAVLDNDADVSLVYGLPQHRREDGSLVKVLLANFLNCPPPQKENFLPFWLGTFFVCPENTFCVRTSVFKECFPRFEPTGCFLQNHALLAFNYNFNTKGYLPYFLPVVASFGRSHHDSNNRKLTVLNRAMREQYFTAIMQYENELLSGQRKHVFRSGNSNIIKTLGSKELEQYKPQISYFRNNREAILSKKKKNRLSRIIEKFKKLISCY